MKFLHVTDIHLCGNIPGSRKDNFVETVMSKLIWVGIKATEIGAEAVFITGDIFHVPNIPNIVLNDLIGVLQNAFNVPVYIIPGNHDIYGNNPKTIMRTSLGVLVAANAVKNIDHEVVEFIEGNQRVLLTGASSESRYDSTPDLYSANWVDKNDGDILINMVHGSLFPERRSDDDVSWEHISFDEVVAARPKADIILAGHIHSGFDITERNGVHFVNPGALLRLTTANSDINLDVKCAIIDIDSDGNIDIQYEKLPPEVAAPADIILDIERAREHRAQSGDIASLIGRVNQINGSSGDGVGKNIDAFNDTIDRYCDELNLSDATKNLAKQYLADADEEVE